MVETDADGHRKVLLKLCDDVPIARPEMSFMLTKIVPFNNSKPRNLTWKRKGIFSKITLATKYKTKEFIDVLVVSEMTA